MTVPVVLLAIATGRAAPQSSGGTASSQAPTSTRPASRTSDRDEALIRKLLDDATGRRQGPAMERVLDGMHASRIKLSGHFDPGVQTQRIQRQVLSDLDEAIAEALKTQRFQSGAGTTLPADKTPRPATASAPKREASDDCAAAQDSASPKSDDTPTRGRPATGPSAPLGEMRELRRGWGWLPLRDREEVLQGFEQDFLLKYREWIERYYRALASPQPE